MFHLLLLNAYKRTPILIKLGGEEKMLRVMTDMRNFTVRWKVGADVGGFTAIMNAYMTAISKPVFERWLFN
jgi:hypothetical protein